MNRSKETDPKQLEQQVKVGLGLCERTKSYLKQTTRKLHSLTMSERKKRNKRRRATWLLFEINSLERSIKELDSQISTKKSDDQELIELKERLEHLNKLHNQYQKEYNQIKHY